MFYQNVYTVILFFSRDVDTYKRNMPTLHFLYIITNDTRKYQLPIC